MRKKLKRIIAFSLLVNMLCMSVTGANIKAMTQAPPIENSAVVAWLTELAASGGSALAGVSMGPVAGIVIGLAVLGYVVKNPQQTVDFFVSVKDGFVQWCADSSEWCSLKAAELENWLSMIANGTLDQASDCWEAFKDYCVALKNSIDGVNSGENASNVIKVEGVNKWLDAQLGSGISGKQCRSVKGNQLTQSFDYKYLANWGNSFYISEKTQLVSLKFINQNVLLAINPSWDATMESDFFNNCGFSSYALDSAKDVYSFDGKDGIPAFSGMWVWGMSGGKVITDENVITYELDYSLYETLMDPGIYVPVLLSLATGLVNGYDDWAIEIPKDDGIPDEVAQGLTVAGGTSGIIDRDGSLDNVDVVEVGGTATDDIISLDLEDVTVDDIVKPYPFDDVVPVDMVDGVVVGTDTPIDEVVKPDGDTDTDTVRDNYTLSGLSKLFPFCIPFDLVALYRTLKADAEAPKFTWTFVYFLDGKKKTEDIEIDLSKFDSVAQLLRTMELLAFMIALTLKTRDLIRG